MRIVSSLSFVSIFIFFCYIQLLECAYPATNFRPWPSDRVLNTVSHSPSFVHRHRWVGQEGQRKYSVTVCLCNDTCKPSLADSSKTFLSVLARAMELNHMLRYSQHNQHQWWLRLICNIAWPEARPNCAGACCGCEVRWCLTIYLYSGFRAYA